MSEWHEYKIGEIVELSQGLAINKQTKHLLKASGLPLLRITDMFFDNYSQYVDPINVPQQCIVNESEIIYTRTGQVGFVFKGKTGVIHNNCFKVKPKKTLDSDFLFWFLKQSAIKEFSNNIASGSVQLDLPHSAFKSIPIRVPPLLEQKAIASVLSSLDDKIDLLHRQNKTLEAMAETLFRQWFVEEAEDDWEHIKLGDIVDTVSGYNHKNNQLIELGDYLLSMGSIVKAYGINIEATRFIDTSSVDTKYICDVGDIVITTRDVTQNANLLGSPGIIPSYFNKRKVVVGSNLYKLKVKSSKLNRFVIYH